MTYIVLGGALNSTHSLIPVPPPSDLYKPSHSDGRLNYFSTLQISTLVLCQNCDLNVLSMFEFVT